MHLVLQRESFRILSFSFSHLFRNCFSAFREVLELVLHFLCMDRELWSEAGRTILTFKFWYLVNYAIFIILQNRLAILLESH